MWKFMRGKGHQPTAERLKLQKELFAFKKTVHHGFPNRPSALAWDSQLKVMAIGTRTGTVKIYGAPGVEFYGEHENECSVMQLFFLPNQGRLISLCDDNTLHLWEINFNSGKSEMEEVKSCSLEGRLKKISTCCLQSNAEHLLIGTEGGNIYLLDVKSFEMTDHIIYQDVVMQNVPDDYKVNPGAVEAISEHPTDPSKILIGYNRGLLVLWDNNALNADQTYVGSQQLESISWHRKGTQFMSAHNDGSFIIWSTNDSTKPEQAPNTPYGPFPCKAINKIQWRTAKRGDFIIFSGGMPRASFGDRHTVSVMQEEKHLVFDFTSRVVDFFVISDNDDESDFDNPNALVVLAEEEMLVIDLESEDWPVFRTPYLASLHSSAITCAHHYTDVPEDLWDKIVASGKLQTKDTYSQREWPIVGGKKINETKETRDLLLTGHEDGTVRMWDASGVALYPLYKLSTAPIFTGEENNEQNAGEESEEWPPFRKVGSFDPYSDDPRLAVKKMCLCILSGTMVVAGTSGQVLIFNLNNEEVEKEVEVSTVNIVGDRDNFVWKGHDQLQVKSGPLKFGSGFQPSVIMQILPPAACTALVLGSDCGLVGAGTSHGLALFDYIQKKSVIVKCTLNPNDISGVSDMTMSRRKSFKKSLRESFRRLRKGRSQRNTDKKKSPSRSSSSVEEKSESSKQTPVTDLDAPTPTEPLATVPPDTKPIERQVEARTADDAMGSIVRCLYLAQSFIISVANTTLTLWAGTNSGAVYVFTVSLPSKEKRKEVPISCQLGKEIQLKHRAPVIAICIIDASNCPLPEPFEVEQERAKNPDNNGCHRVVICSEEQFKVFTLPSLKPYCKFKLTAHEGARVRKIGFVNFRSKSDPNYHEYCITCLTNQGDVSIYTIPELRRQLANGCIKREDINGISSLVFSRNGQGFYLHSSSEMQRFSLSAHNITEAHCTLELPEGMRPTLEPEKIKIEESVPVTQTIEKIGLDSITDDGKEEEKIADHNESSIIEEGKKDDSTGDITIDSVRDHLVSSTEESHITITERKEEKVEIKEESVTVIQTTTILAATETTGAIED